MHAVTSQSASSASSTSPSRPIPSPSSTPPSVPRTSPRRPSTSRDTGRIYVGYDWGFTDPTHIGLYQYRDGALYQFDELVGSGRSEASWVEEIVARIAALPGYDGPTLDGWRRVWADQQPWPHLWPDTWPDACAGDPSAVQFRFELNERAMGGQQPEDVRHAVVSGQDVLRTLILSGDDRRRFFIHPRCTRTVEAFKNYRATELAEGSTTRGQTQTPPTTHLVTAPTRRATSAGFSGGCLAWPAMRANP